MNPNTSSLLPAGGEDPARRVRRHLRVIFAKVDRTFEKGLNDAAMVASCARGCSHCCHLPVASTSLEAIAAVSAFVRDRGAAELLARWSRMDRAPNDSAAYFDAQIPCVFLDDSGDCAVYEVRPAPCRVHVSLDEPDLCAPPSGKTVRRPDSRQLEWLSVALQNAAADELKVPFEIGTLHELVRAVATELGYAPTTTSTESRET